MPAKTKEKPKRIRFPGYTKEESDAIHDRAERLAQALVTPVPKTRDKKEKNVNA